MAVLNHCLFMNRPTVQLNIQIKITSYVQQRLSIWHFRILTFEYWTLSIAAYNINTRVKTFHTL